MKNELMWEARIFSIMAIMLIFFSCLVLRACLGMCKEAFIIVTVPSLCLSLISSLLILTFEFTLWYIFRLKGKRLNVLTRNKR